MSKAFFTFTNQKTMICFIQHFLEQIPKSVVFLSFWDMLTKRSIKNMKRELEPLKQITDNYPKYILTLDNDPDSDYEGIRKINVLKWLIKETN